LRLTIAFAPAARRKFETHTMSQITKDNHPYDLDTLSDDASAQMQCLQFVDAELATILFS